MYYVVINLLRVELLVGLGVVLQDLSGLELDALLVSEAEHHVNKLLSAHLVDETERSALERREADAENGSDIAYE